MAVDTSKYKMYRLFLLEPSAKYRALCTWPTLVQSVMTLGTG